MNAARLMPFDLPNSALYLAVVRASRFPGKGGVKRWFAYRINTHHFFGSDLKNNFKIAKIWTSVSAIGSPSDEGYSTGVIV